MPVMLITPDIANKGIDARTTKVISHPFVNAIVNPATNTAADCTNRENFYPIAP
jgi:hypothetical protein